MERLAGSSEAGVSSKREHRDLYVRLGARFLQRPGRRRSSSWFGTLRGLRPEAFYEERRLGSRRPGRFAAFGELSEARRISRAAARLWSSLLDVICVVRPEAVLRSQRAGLSIH